jgi:hypothetical protein
MADGAERGWDNGVEILKRWSSSISRLNADAHSVEKEERRRKGAVRGEKAAEAGEAEEQVEKDQAKERAPGRRAPTKGDADFPTQEEALKEALTRHGVDPTTVETELMYGKNPNLVGPKGEPWESVRGLDGEGNIVEFDHHANGHTFTDKGEF